MFSRRKINKKLDLILHRQSMMMEFILCAHLEYDKAKKFEKKWNKLWYEIVEGKDGKRS